MDLAMDATIFGSRGVFDRAFHEAFMEACANPGIMTGDPRTVRRSTDNAALSEDGGFPLMAP
jgi:hypothetical protein